ncbi:MAG: 4Fe-4S binding protein, partial [Saprospiraceae bacterium]|nr:4Fe-4S binding protein [Saprospiraceae bacterium]
IALGIYLIGFYVILYFYPEHLVNWVIMVDPLSRLISGNPASQWFLYGFLYTLAILVMGVRMMIRYRHNRYQVIRTISVMFFQTAFAFLIPEILVRLNQPYYDFKNIWPLDYDFFFGYNIDNLIQSGGLGIFMLVWGIALVIIGVPVITYFYGKRWYCSWVCGCGGLAETLGDPYRHLSDNSLMGWQIERIIVHGVLAFAVVMTGLTLYTYFSNDPMQIGINRWLIIGLLWFAAAGLFTYHRKLFPKVSRQKMINMIGIFAGIPTAILLFSIYSDQSQTLFMSSYEVRKWYGFYIGATFSGVVGTGFYPFMGNRVWCRFGCPLAAYLGIVQRFKSRFRITSNGGQCISCGNCSVYCEMGIDVRWYAQRGQDVVRASCVGCGICSAVCPRGVLRLENSSKDISTRTVETRAILIKDEEVKLAEDEKIGLQ